MPLWPAHEAAAARAGRALLPQRPHGVPARSRALAARLLPPPGRPLHVRAGRCCRLRPKGVRTLRGAGHQAAPAPKAPPTRAASALLPPPAQRGAHAQARGPASRPLTPGAPLTCGQGAVAAPPPQGVRTLRRAGRPAAPAPMAPPTHAGRALLPPPAQGVCTLKRAGRPAASGPRVPPSRAGGRCGWPVPKRGARSRAHASVATPAPREPPHARAGRCGWPVPQTGRTLKGACRCGHPRPPGAPLTCGQGAAAASTAKGEHPNVRRASGRRACVRCCCGVMMGWEGGGIDPQSPVLPPSPPLPSPAQTWPACPDGVRTLKGAGRPAAPAPRAPPQCGQRGAGLQAGSQLLP